MSSQMTSRRTVARGLAWSVPAIAAVAAAPLAAASQCQTSVSRSAQASFDWGVRANQGQRRGTTTQVMVLAAGAITVTGLERGVTVESITVESHILRREGQDSTGPGVFYVGNQTVNKTDVGYEGNTSSGTLTPLRPTPNRSLTGMASATHTTATAFAAPGSGWSQTIQAQNGIPNVEFGHNITGTAWKLTYTWSRQRDRIATYTQTADGCYTFNSGTSGRFNVTYSGVSQLYTDESFVTAVPPQRNITTVRLSDGRTLTYLGFS